MNCPHQRCVLSSFEEHMPNYGERLVYWYLRLQGFCPVENFVLHRRTIDDKDIHSADADLLAISFASDCRDELTRFAPNKIRHTDRDMVAAALVHRADDACRDTSAGSTASGALRGPPTRQGPGRHGEANRRLRGTRLAAWITTRGSRGPSSRRRPRHRPLRCGHEAAGMGRSPPSAADDRRSCGVPALPLDVGDPHRRVSRRASTRRSGTEMLSPVHRCRT